MASAPVHHARLLPTPWAGIHACEIDSGHHFPRHWHAVHGVGVLDDGAQRSASGRGAVEAFAGDVIASHPGEVHDGRPLGGPSRRWRMLHVEPQVMAELLALPGATSPTEAVVACPVIYDETLAMRLRQLFRRLEPFAVGGPRDNTASLACEEALTRAVQQLAAHTTRARVQAEVDACVAAARDRLAADLLDPPSLATLAKGAGLSRYQLLRRFERTYGVPPHAWLLMHRAEQVRQRIRRGEPLADAAAATGFADQSHMGRVFRRQFGYSPGAWQAAACGGAVCRPGG